METLDTSTHRRAGAVIMSGFALLWALAGSTGLPTGGVLVSIVAVGITALVAVAAVFHRGPGEYVGPVVEDWRRRYNRLGLLELLAVVAVVAAGVLSGRPGLIPAAVCVVVAVHFVPLAGVFGVPSFLRVAWVLGVVGLVGLAVSWNDPDAGRAVVGLGAAATLWWAALPPLSRRSR
jgi:hypothetical protein